MVTESKPCGCPTSSVVCLCFGGATEWNGERMEQEGRVATTSVAGGRV